MKASCHKNVASTLVYFFQPIENISKSYADWFSSNPIIEGVEWKKGQQTITHGIWMWNKPFVIKRADGQMVRSGLH